MKRGSILFLKFAIGLIATIAVLVLFWFPQTEGRSVNLDLVSIYSDPFIIYGYIASIPFFVALYHLFNLLGYVDKNKVFSQEAIKSVRNIKYCTLTIPVFIFIGLVYIRLFIHGEDAAGPTGLGIIVSFIFFIFATGAAVFERILQNAVEIKSENDLTV